MQDTVVFVSHLRARFLDFPVHLFPGCTAKRLKTCQIRDLGCGIPVSCRIDSPVGKISAVENLHLSETAAATFILSFCSLFDLDVPPRSG
jgi:hypothetical protein